MGSLLYHPQGLGDQRQYCEVKLARVQKAPFSLPEFLRAILAQALLASAKSNSFDRALVPRVPKKKSGSLKRARAFVLASKTPAGLAYRSENAEPLIPGLPDDLSRLCLSLVPRSEHLNARAVCQGWRRFFHDEECYNLREELGLVELEEEWLHDLVLSEGLDLPEDQQAIDAKRKKFRPTGLSGLMMGAFRDCGKASHEWEVWVHAGKVFKISGLSWVSGKPTSVLLKYNDSGRRWEPCASMKIPRHSYAYGALWSHGPIYVVGGYGGKDGRSRLTSAEMYDPWQDKWFFIPAYITLHV